MIPHSLKIAWFSLSLSGLVTCWITFIRFGRKVGVYWGPVAYCVGCTIMQLFFCLGLIWGMNPFLMPRRFCIVQPIFMGFATFLMSGVAAAFSVATSMAALKPKTWSEGGTCALGWRWFYIFPLIVYPVFASAIQIAVVLRYDTGHRSSSFFCDYADPVWIRFLSYAGIPLVVYVPFFYLSIRSLLRISKTNGHLKRSRDPGMDIDRVSDAPHRPKRVHFMRPRTISVRSQKAPRTSKSEPLCPSPTLTSSCRFSLSLSRPKAIPSSSLKLETLNESPNYPEMTPPKREESRTSPSSSAFSLPRFANPSSAEAASTEIDAVAVAKDGGGEATPTTRSESKEDWRQMLGASSVDEDRNDIMRLSSDAFDSDFRYEERKESRDDDTVDSYFGANHRRSLNRSFGIFKSRRPLPSLPSSILQVILFQCSFIFVPLFGFLSTFVDSVQGRHPPSSFGTQHIALLLSAWGPVLIFGLAPVAKKVSSTWIAWT